MGNCYSAGQEDLETSLAQNKMVRNNKAQAGFAEEEDQTPDVPQLPEENLEAQE